VIQFNSCTKFVLQNLDQAYKIYKLILGAQNVHTQQCALQMKHFTMLCVKQQQQQQQIAASAAAQQLAAKMSQSPSRKKNNNKKKKSR
jgi:hypothetical protein